MKNISRKKEAIIWILLLAPFVYALIMWSRLPQQIPTHFNIKGEVDDYSDKSVALFLLPGMNVFLYFILFFIPRIDPRYKNYSLFGSSYQNIRMIIHLFFVGIFVYITMLSLGNGVLPMSGFFSIMFLFFALLGNYFRTVRSNWFIGIRTPWTLSNDVVWKKTHELGGRIWFYAGVLGAVIVFFVPEKTAPFVFMPFVIVMVLIPVVYSYFEYQKVIKLPRDVEHTSQQ